MRRIKLIVAYDGTNYCGWQTQPNGITVQGVLNDTLAELLGEKIETIGASRTDAGVHAMGNVAVFDTNTRIPGEKSSYALNQRLPEDIRIVKVELAKNGFHARKSAKGKKYEYYIDCREKPDVFSRRYCYHYPEKLDIEAMRDATRYLIGPKNFTSFTDDKECKDPVRKITNIKIVRSGEKVRITYYGTGKRDASMLPVVIAAEDRSLAGFLAPARGLFLRKVYY